MIVRVLNPSAEPDDVVLTFGFDVAVEPARLDETPTDLHTSVDGRRVSLRVPPHALRSLRVQALRR
jgi:hypothetical protein